MFSRQITQIPIHCGNCAFELGGLSGTLFTFEARPLPPRPSRVLPSKIRNAAEYCSNPYLLSAPALESPVGITPPLSPEAERLAIKFVSRLIKLSRFQFFLARLYAAWRVSLFATAREATLFFRKHAKGDQEELCLARALFAAKTSRRFPQEGVVVIGVFLPSRAMHAWVIEGDEIADPYDEIWINYQPVAMLS